MEKMNRMEILSGRLAENGLDALLVTSEVGRRYLTGFHSSAGLVLLTADGAWFFTDSRYIEAARREVHGFQVGQTTMEFPYSRRVREILGENACIGFEEGTMSVASLERWRKELGCRMMPAQKLLDEMRSTKSAEEQAKMRAAQQLTDELFTELLGILCTGVTEREVAAEIQYRFLKKGAEGVSFAPIVVSGENSSMPHGVPGDRKLQRGDFVTMDFGCILDGWCSDMTRTVAIGYATEEMRRVYQTVLTAQQAGIAAYRAGVEGRAVDEAAREVIRRAGYGEAFGHGFGHSLGMEVHESPNASPGDRTVLPAGAVLSAEPGIYLPGKFGVRIEDVVIVTETGCIDITGSPRELLIL